MHVRRTGHVKSWWDCNHPGCTKSYSSITYLNKHMRTVHALAPLLQLLPQGGGQGGGHAGQGGQVGGHAGQGGQVGGQAGQGGLGGLPGPQDGDGANIFDEMPEYGAEDDG